MHAGKFSKLATTASHTQGYSGKAGCKYHKKCLTKEKTKREHAIMQPAATSPFTGLCSHTGRRVYEWLA